MELHAMNVSLDYVNDTIDDVNNNDSNMTYNENLGARIVGLYLPLAFRPVMTLLVIYLALSAIDAIVTVRRRRSQQLYSIEFFFLIMLLINDIITVVVTNVVALSVILNTLANPDTKGVKCYYIAASHSVICGTSLFVTLVCFDRMMFCTKHNWYIRFMTKRKRYVLVGVVWLITVMSNILLPFDTTLEEMTKNGVCIHKPFVNHYGTVVIILPAFLAVVMVIIQNVYVFRAAYKSNMLHDEHMSVSGQSGTPATANQRRQQSQFIRVLRMSRRSAFTAILLASAHVIFGAALPLIEYLVCPQYEGLPLYVVLTSVVFVVFEFVNLMIHPLLYGFYTQMIRRNLRHREFYVCLYQLFCCRF